MLVCLVCLVSLYPAMPTSATHLRTACQMSDFLVITGIHHCVDSLRDNGFGFSERHDQVLPNPQKLDETCGYLRFDHHQRLELCPKCTCLLVFAGNGRAGTDRSNLVQLQNRQETVPLPMDKRLSSVASSERDLSNAKRREILQTR